MFNVILLIAFLFILVIDFVKSFLKKNVNGFEVVIRGLMILIFCHICSWI